MRQGHQNRRGRGRGNNGGQHNNNQNRKGQNPLTRTFESNGPDVKIRGTPAHIAEKYISLARDAKSSGDEVLAENYLQHAEHYNRIILAFREQQISQGGDPNAGGMGQRFRVPQLNDGPDDEDFNEDGDDIGGSEQPVVRMNDPQPNVAGGQPGPYEGGGGERPERQDRGEQRDYYRQDQRHDRQDRNQGGQRFDDRQRRPDHFRNRDRDRDRDRDRHAGDYRQPGGDRQPDRDRDRDRDRGYDRDRQYDRPQGQPPADQASMVQQPERVAPPPAAIQPAAPAPAPIAAEPAFEPVNGQRPARGEGAPRGERPERDENAPPRRRERFQAQPHEQPEFLRRPVRRPRREAAPVESGEGGGDANGAAPVPPRDNSGPAK